MIDNVNDMEWKNKDTLRSMVEKYNTNLHDLVNEANHKATCTDDNTVVSSNNSYARVCEWSDRNQHGEDRTGYFVSTTSEGVVEIANSESKVLGVSVKSPAFSSDVKDEKLDYTKNLLSDYCYVALMGSVQVRQDGTLEVGQRCVSNAVGIATLSENVGCIVTRIIDNNTAVISLEPSTESIKQAYEFLFNKIENKKAGLIEVDYATWTNLSNEERVALGDVIVPDHPVDYSLEDVKKNVDKLSTDVTEIKSTIKNGDLGSAKYLKATEETNFVYDSAITTTIVDGVLKNVFNADENLSVYKDRDETKFSLGTITYTSAVEVDLRIEDDNAWRWYCILPISAEQSTVDITTVKWVLSGYQPNHADTEEKPTEPTISTVGFITFLLENSSDASDTATFDIYDLSNVTTKTARVSLSNPSENSTLELLPTSVQYNGKNLVRSVNRVGADEQGNVQLGNVGAITGEIKWFAFNTAPDGYLVCNGAKVSRETYADLFAVIGTTFGSGDGSTTFNLPDLRDRYIIGANTNALGTQIAEQLPNIKGNAFLLTDIGNTSGALYKHAENWHHDYRPQEGVFADALGLDASHSSSVYTNNGHVYPLSLALLPCIKY